jgi:hypothetical protein
MHTLGLLLTKNSLSMHVKKNENQAMSLQVTEGLTVTILPNSNHEFLMPTHEVAIGYGVSQGNIREHKRVNPSELIEGKHFVTGVRISDSDAYNKVFWTKRGIVRLGFFIKSDRAKLFRDWAEDLVINQVEKTKTRAISPKAIESMQPFKPVIELVESASVIAGNQARLAKRLGIAPAFFCHIVKRPWLVSEDMMQAIETGCRNIISNKNVIDTEALEALMLIKDQKVRMLLFNKMKRGGLI